MKGFPRSICLPLFIILTFFSLFLNIHISFAQKTEFSPEERSDNKYIRILGEDDEGTYILKSNLPLIDTRLSNGFKKREFTLSYYSDELHLKASKVVSAPKKDDKTLALTFFQDKPLAFFLHYLEDQKKYNILGSFLDHNLMVENLMPLNDFTFSKKSDTENLEFLNSPDQNNLLVYQQGGMDNGNLALHMVFCSKGLTDQKSKALEIPLSGKDYAFYSFSLTNDGRLFLLVRKRRPDKDEHTMGYKIYQYQFALDKLSDTALEPEGKMLTGAGFSFDSKNNKLVLSGFYSEKTGYSIAGIFYSSFDANSLAQLSFNSQTFDQDFLSRIIGENRSANKELMNFFIDKIVLRNDGGAVILAESFYTSTSTYYDVFLQTYMTRINYHYNSILCISINPDGSIHWPQVINKEQTSTEDGGYYSSYSSIVLGGKICFLYNDLSARNPRVMLASIDNSGKADTRVLFKSTDQVLIVPKAGRQTEENVLLIPSEKNGRFCYLKITF